jgi:predicted small metal-binding protein
VLVPVFTCTGSCRHYGAGHSIESGVVAVISKKNLTCPCGVGIRGTDEDDLVEKVQHHLKELHPGHDYSRDEILFMAY